MTATEPPGSPPGRAASAPGGSVTVRAVLRDGGTDVRTRTVNVDASADIAGLRDDLARELGLDRPGDCALRLEGSLADPVLVLWHSPGPPGPEDVILFPGTDDTLAALRQVKGQVAQFRADLAGIRPYRTWSTATWHAQTLKFRTDAPGRQAGLISLAELARPEERSGSKWAADVTQSVRRALAALDTALAVAGSPEHDTGSARDFQESKDALDAALDRLHELLTARLAFPPRSRH